MANKIKNTTGSILNRYEIVHDSGLKENVRLNFRPSDDYVQGSPFNEETINPIIDELNNTTSKANTNTQNIALSKRIIEVVLSTSSWTSGSRTITVSGITSNDNPICYPKLTGTIEQKQAIKEEYNKIVDIDVNNGSITVYVSEPITTSITICLKGV